MSNAKYLSEKDDDLAAADGGMKEWRNFEGGNNSNIKW